MPLSSTADTCRNQKDVVNFYIYMLVQTLRCNRKCRTLFLYLNQRIQLFSATRNLQYKSFTIWSWPTFIRTKQYNPVVHGSNTGRGVISPRQLISGIETNGHFFCFRNHVGQLVSSWSLAQELVITGQLSKKAGCMDRPPRYDQTVC